MNTQEESRMATVPSPDEYTRRAVRSFWADGLWDLAMAGFFATTALWGHVWVRILAFPAWTWPWPFTTDQTDNPMQGWFLAWNLAIFPLVVLYLWGTTRLVQRLKARLVAPRSGYARHPLNLPLERRVYYVYVGLSAVGILLLIGLYTLLKGGPHVMSVVFAVPPAGLLFAIGRVYDLPRYRWAGVVGLGLSVGLELFATTAAVYLNGPRNLLDVSPLWGSAAVPMAVFAVVLACSGLVALARLWRQRDGD